MIQDAGKYFFNIPMTRLTMLMTIKTSDGNVRVVQGAPPLYSLNILRTPDWIVFDIIQPDDFTMKQVDKRWPVSYIYGNYEREYNIITLTKGQVNVKLSSLLSFMHHKISVVVKPSTNFFKTK